MQFRQTKFHMGGPLVGYTEFVEVDTASPGGGATAAYTLVRDGSERVVLEATRQAPDRGALEAAVDALGLALARADRRDLARQFPGEGLPRDDGDPAALPAPWRGQDGTATMAWAYKRQPHVARLQRYFDGADGGRRYLLRVESKGKEAVRQSLVAASLAAACGEAMATVRRYQPKK